MVRYIKMTQNHDLFSSGISGIPALVVVKLDGTVVTKDGRSQVTGKAPAQAVKDWKA